MEKDLDPRIKAAVKSINPLTVPENSCSLKAYNLTHCNNLVTYIVSIEMSNYLFPSLIGWAVSFISIVAISLMTEHSKEENIDLFYEKA